MVLKRGNAHVMNECVLFWSAIGALMWTYAYRKRRGWLPAVWCCYFHRNSCRSHSLDSVVDYSDRLNYCWGVRAVSVSLNVMFCVANPNSVAIPGAISPASHCSSLFPCSGFPCLWKKIQLFASLWLQTIIRWMPGPSRTMGRTYCDLWKNSLKRNSNAWPIAAIKSAAWPPPHSST